MNRIADDGSLAKRRSPRPQIDEEIRTVFTLQIVIVFNVVADQLKVADLTAPNEDSRDRVVADVAVVDDDLMQIDTVEKYANFQIVVDMTMTDDQVAIALFQVDTCLAAAN